MGQGNGIVPRGVGDVACQRRRNLKARSVYRKYTDRATIDKPLGDSAAYGIAARGRRSIGRTAASTAAAPPAQNSEP